MSVPPYAASTPTRIVTVGGGKGGVGKSVVAASLAAALAQTGRRVVLVDLDLGSASQHQVLGLGKQKPGVPGLFGTEGRAEEALVETRVANLRLLPGGGTPGALGLGLSPVDRVRVGRRLRTLGAEIVVVDVGAGTDPAALDLLALGAHRIVVATPQVTAIHDAYAFLKGAVLRCLRREAEKASLLSTLDAGAPGRDGERVSDLLARIREQDVACAARMSELLQRFGAAMIGNQVQEPSQIGVFHAVSKMILDYLQVAVPILGWLRVSTRLQEPASKNSPLLLGTGNGEDARTFRTIVETLLGETGAPVDEEIEAAPVGEDTAPAADESAPIIEIRRGSGAPLARDGQAGPAGEEASAATDEAMPPADEEEPTHEVAPTPSSTPNETVPAAPVVVKPRVYVRPPRKRRATADKKKASDLDEESPRRRKRTLPGMPPIRVQK